MKNIFRILSKYKFKIAVLALVLVVQAYCDLALPEYVRMIIDNGILIGGTGNSSVNMDYLLNVGARMMLMTLIMFIASAVVAYMASRIGAKVGRDLRIRTYKRVMSYSEAELDHFSTASLITRCTNDVQQIQLVVTMILRMLLYAPVLGIYGVIKITYTEARMEWIIGLAVLIVAGLVMLLFSLTMPKFKIMQDLVDGLNKVSREILTGLPVVRAFGNEKLEEERFDKANKALTENQLFTNKIMSLMQPTMMLLMNAIVALITWVAAHNIAAGRMQVGQMTEFITYSITIVMSFLFMSMMSIMLPRAGVAADRIMEVIDTEPTIKDVSKGDVDIDNSANNKESAANLSGVAEIKFDHVHFRYPGAEEDALKDIDFTAEAGETTAIIGSTGCGKTTLIDLIPRLYDVTKGSVRLNGIDVRDIPLKMLRDSVGFVPQKGLLFSGTIESNIRFGNEEATSEEITEAAEIAKASEFIDSFEDGYESSISQGGTNVSGGQKQRLAIARAIVKKPKVIVFDDSLSAVDMKTDAELRKAISEKLSGVTRIIVAQRISTVMNADQIIVMEDGEIRGRGTHDELMSSCDVYREIAVSQLSKAELG